MTNQFSILLADQNDIDIVALGETLEAVLNFTDWSVWKRSIRGLASVTRRNPLITTATFLTFVNNHEIWVTILVDFTNSAQQESNTGVLVTNNSQQFSFYSRVQCHFCDGFFHEFN